MILEILSKFRRQISRKETTTFFRELMSGTALIREQILDHDYVFRNKSEMDAKLKMFYPIQSFKN